MSEEEKKKKKSRKLYDIEVDEITLCANPATRKTFSIVKQDKFTGILKDMLDEDEDEEILELAKALSPETLDLITPWLEEIQKYLPDLPCDFEDSIRNLVKECIKLSAESSGDSKNEEKKEEKDMKKNEEDWPSIPLPADIVLKDIKKAETLADKDEEDEDEEDFDDPLLETLKNIEKQLAGKKDPEDLWPSLYLPTFAKVEKSEPEIEKEEEPAKAVKRSLGVDEGIITKKEEVFVDDWPSVFDCSIYRSE